MYTYCFTQNFRGYILNVCMCCIMRNKMTVMTIIIIIIKYTTRYLECCHLRHEVTCGAHFGSSERKSVSARWPPTHRPGCKLELRVRLYAMHCYSTIRLILIYCPSKGGRLSWLIHCGKCAYVPKRCVSQWFSWTTQKMSAAEVLMRLMTMINKV